MKRLLIAAGLTCLLILPGVSSAQVFCRVTVKAQVEVAPGRLSLADLLSADTCPGFTHSASDVDLGSAPLSGSVRVLAGAEVRVRLEKLTESLANGTAGALQSIAATLATRRTPIPQMFIPERISIRRAGARASCADLGARLLAASGIFSSAPPLAVPAKSLAGTWSNPAAAVVSSAMDCGAAGRIAQETPVQLTRTIWDSTLGSWDISGRCVHPGDCVPFLVRVPGSSPSAAHALLASSSSKAAPLAIEAKPLVRAGDKVILLWDQDGIRLTVPAVCLDAGAEGQRVRARIVSGDRTLPAIVVSAGVLRAAS